MVGFSVIGLGSVGWAVVHGLCSKGYSYAGYDIAGDYDWNSILDSKISFVCVSTPIGDDGHLDCSNIDDALEKLSESDYSGVVVIKSTVSVGYMDSASTRFPTLRLVYMPEFLRERSSFKWFLKPDRLVLSGAPEDVDAVLGFFSWVENAETLIMSHKEAEIGKLAHNAYIATKVSFTNEIEAFCSASKCDSSNVMSVIWADRRVKCRSHLTPGLGSYDGKCVPKDTHELITSFPDSVLLRAVEAVKSNHPFVSHDFSLPKALVIIPTKDRPEKLRRALESICNQTVRPDYVVVVSDCSGQNKELTSEVVSSFVSSLNIELIRNCKTSNLSGAVNSGISHSINAGFKPSDTFVALLDDDDWWDVKYLENCLRFALETGSDWIISGLIRHDGENVSGVYQSIPNSVSIDDFLESNPNIQGSNMFVRLSKFYEAGGFDENLVSTTDRDFCISLLGLKDISYSILNNHLVHHDASDDSTRLSHPSSENKRTGLQSFFDKHESRMSSEQREQFKLRAQKLFSIDIHDKRSMASSGGS